jgi:CDGSH-type Zn-finger protein
MAVKITVVNNGPLRVEGEPTELNIVDAAGQAFGLAGRATVSLCRCGQSQKKPFCDGSHRQGFQSMCEAHDLPAPAPKA